MPIFFRPTLLSISLFVTATLADAQTYSWAAEDGFWDEAENWQPQTPNLPAIPNFLAITDISHDDNVDRRVTFRRGLNGTNPVYFLRYLMLGNTGSGNTTFVMSEYDGVIPGTETILGIDPHELTTTRLWVGNDGSGSVDMTGGTLNVTQGLLLGKITNTPIAGSGILTNRGEFHMSGGNLHLEVEGQPSEPLIDIGVNTSGLFVQTGGHIHAQEFGNEMLRLGVNRGQIDSDARVGRYELIDGTLQVSKVNIGQGFRGEFVQGGGLSNIFDLQVGDTDQGGNRVTTGRYELNGGRLETLGFSTTVNTNGTFEMTGGVHDTRALFVHGEYQMSDGSLTIDQRVRVSGRFTQNGGTVNLATGDSDALQVSDGGVYQLNAGSVSGGGLEIGGSFLQTGGTLNVGGQDLRVTETGGWTWIGGTVSGLPNSIVIDGQAAMSGPNGLLLDIDVGKASGSDARYTISGSSDLLSGTIDLGIAGKGTLDVQTSGTVSLLNLNVGQVSGSQGVAIVRSGKLDTAALRVGELGIGSVDLRGGEIEATVSLDIHDGGEFLQSGGTATTPVANLHGTTDITGGFVDASHRINLAQDANLTLAGDFFLQANPPENSPEGSMTTPELNFDGGMLSARRFIADGGTLTITGDHNRITAATSLNGTTITNNGVLEFAGETSFNGAAIDGTGSLINRGDLTTGFANIDQTFTNTGNLILDSGAVTDSMMVFMNQTFTQTSSGRLVMSALDPISLTSYDSISFGEQANLAGTFELVLEEGFDAVAGTTLTLLNFAGTYSPETGLTPRVSGAFESLVLPDLGEGLSWDASQLNSIGALSIVASPVPEPATTVLLFSGIVAGCVVSRRRPRPSS